VHDYRLGKGQCHAHKTGQTLTERIVPAFDMSGFSRLFAHGKVMFLGKHCRIGRPEIRETMPVAIPFWNGLPQPLTRLFAPIPNRIGDHLPGVAAECNPNPGVVGFFEHKRPQFVQFQYRGCRILWIGSDQRCAQWRELGTFFLIQRDTVVRETPNVRVRPRRLLRSW
jgi:hypothetical protein